MISAIRGAMAVVAVATLAGNAGAQTAAPPQPNDPSLVSCDGLSGDGLALCQLINRMNPAGNWPKGVHVNDLAGVQDRPTGAVAESTETHCSSFAAAVAYQQGIYLMRPPQHVQSLLASDQFTWLWNQSATNPTPIPPRPSGSGPATPRAGWTNLGNGDQAMLDAQAYANRGYTVFATYRNEFDTASCLASFYADYVDKLDPTKDTIPYSLPAARRAQLCPANVAAGPGHIAVIKPNAGYGADPAAILANGPVEAQAGGFNANGAVVASGFGPHFTKRYIRYFVYGGPPAARQSAFAGLYTAASPQVPAYAIERTAQGSVLAGLVTYDRSGLPIWYYGEGTLTAAESWTATPLPPSTGIPVRGEDHPAFWKPFFQPATSGTNLWDPDGDPVPFARTGWFDLTFSSADNTAMTISLGLADPGRVLGPSHGAIDTDTGQLITVTGQPLTRTPAAAGGMIQPPSANAPAAGWWWAQYSLADWNQATAGFKTYAGFLDIQGTAVNGVLLGFRPATAPTGSTAAPYRPSWYSFSGTSLANGQVDGQLYQCSQAPAGITCSGAGPASFAPAADGSLTAVFGGTSVAFTRYRAVGGNPQSVMVPMPLASSNGASHGYLTAVSVGGGPQSLVTFDTGSSGLRILKANVGSGVVASTTPLTESYADGTVLTGVLATGYVTIGGITTSQPIPFHLVETVSCAADKPSCPASSGSLVGRVGIMGVSQDPGTISSPIAQLPAPFNQGFVASLSGGYVQLGLPAATRASFGTPVALTPLPNPGQTVPAFDRHTPMGCVSFPGTGVAAQCFHTSFDTGSSLATMVAAAGTDLSAVSANGRINSGQSVAFSINGLIAGATVTAGNAPWINAMQISVAAGSNAHHNLGAPVLLGYDLMYDAQAGAIAMRAVTP